MSICISNFVNAPYRDRTDRPSADAFARLLVVDRHPTFMLKQLGQAFSSAEYRIEHVMTGADALKSIFNDPPSIILLDPQLPDRCGLELHREIRRIDARIPVIFVTAARAADDAIVAIKQGAYDYLFKPLDDRQLLRVVRAALETTPHRSSPVVRAVVPCPPEVDGVLHGLSPAMREVYKSIGLVAAQDVNVLITGESGTGKEVVARAIFRHSSRSEAPFLALNCAAIPENLLESELFGHEKGAFSGADRRRIGKFEQYDGGTILLDEIGDMPLSLQAKILRLLQEQTFERVGGNETIRTNVRLIASTHRDLKTWAADGRFRTDLYYRLSVFTIHLPPLRERGEDIPMLVQNYLTRYSREMGREIHDIAQDAMERLRRYHWPGNIRELQSVLKQAVLRSTGEVILSTFLPALADNGPEKAAEQSTPAGNFDIDRFLRQRLSPDACDLYVDIHRELDRHSLARVLNYTRGNQQMAAKVLGIARQTLRQKLRETGLYVAHSVESGDHTACATL